MIQFPGTGNHTHCFCKQDTGGEIVCCKCGARLTPCDPCPVAYCPIRETMIKGIGHGGSYMFNCPIATDRYAVLYRTKV